MCNGDIVIIKDLLGIVVGEKDDKVMLKDKNGTVRPALKSKCVTVVEAHQLAIMLLLKIEKRVKDEIQRDRL